MYKKALASRGSLFAAGNDANNKNYRLRKFDE